MMEELWRAYADRETKLWTWDRELLATIAELIHTLIRQNLQIWGAKAHEVPEPLYIPRPGIDPAEPDKPEAISFKEFISILRMG